MSVSPNKARVNFELDADVNRRLQLVIQWGCKGPCLRILATRLVEAVEEHGQIMVGAILDGRFKLVPTFDDKDRPIVGQKGKDDES